MGEILVDSFDTCKEDTTYVLASPASKKFFFLREIFERKIFSSLKCFSSNEIAFAMGRVELSFFCRLFCFVYSKGSCVLSFLVIDAKGIFSSGWSCCH